MKFTKEGQRKFKKATAEIVQLHDPDNYIGIFIGDSLISAPKVTEEIDSNFCTVTGNFSKDTANAFETQINFAIYKYFIEVMSAR